MSGRQYGLVIILATLCGLGGGFVGPLVFPPPSSQARFGSLEIINPEGNLQGIIRQADSGAFGLTLLDSQGTRRARIGLTADGSPSLTLYDSADEARVLIGLTADEVPLIGLFKEKGDVV